MSIDEMLQKLELNYENIDGSEGALIADKLRELTARVAAAEELARAADITATCLPLGTCGRSRLREKLEVFRNAGKGE